jgi:hypothetical protein
MTFKGHDGFTQLDVSRLALKQEGNKDFSS